jgi:hypothetical protein
MMTTIIALANITTLIVNLYMLWTIRKFLIATAKKTIDKVEDQIKKI